MSNVGAHMVARGAINAAVESAALRAAAAVKTVTRFWNKANIISLSLAPPPLLLFLLLVPTAADGEEPTSAGGKFLCLVTWFPFVCACVLVFVCVCVSMPVCKIKGGGELFQFLNLGQASSFPHRHGLLIPVSTQRSCLVSGTHDYIVL